MGNTDEIHKKAKSIRAALNPLLNQNRKIPMTCRIIVMKIYFKIILSHVEAAWGPFMSKANWNKIEVIQNNSIRTTTGANYLMKF